MMDSTSIPIGVCEAVHEVPDELSSAGLGLRKEVVSMSEEAALLRLLDSKPWETQLSRRTQHYGWRFEYETKSCARANESVPPLLKELVANRLQASDVPWEADDYLQCTINEYLPGNGIAPHVDTHEAFEDGIVALSLGSGVALRLKRSSEAPHFLWLPPRSLVIYRGEVRYAYTHGIVSRKGDLVDGEWRFRERRVSITLRRVNTAARCHCAYPHFCDARDAPKFLPTRLKKPPAS